MLLLPLLAAAAGFFLPIWPSGVASIVAATVVLTLASFFKGWARWRASERQMTIQMAAMALGASGALVLVAIVIGFSVGHGIALLIGVAH